MEIEVNLLEEQELKNIKMYIEDVDKNLIFDSTSTYSITYNNKIVGLITFFDWYLNNKTITILIDINYRGKGIAGIALEKVVEIHGKNNTDINKFLYNVSPTNKSSLKVVEKLNWNMTNEYDEDILKEGTEYFKVYYKKNPYYKKGRVKKYDNR